MLGDEVTSAGVQTAGHVAAQEEVEHRGPSPVLDDESVERELHGPVKGDPARGSLLANEAGAEGVKEDLEGAVQE